MRLFTRTTPQDPEPQDPKLCLNIGQWTTFRGDVGKPDQPLYLTLIKDPTPWRVGLDFTGIDQNSEFLVQVEIELESIVRADLPRWELSELYSIKFAKLVPNYPTQMVINEIGHGPGRLLVIEPISGPWRARLTIAQVHGISTPVRYIRLH